MKKKLSRILSLPKNKDTYKMLTFSDEMHIFPNEIYILLFYYDIFNSTLIWLHRNVSRCK